MPVRVLLHTILITPDHNDTTTAEIQVIINECRYDFINRATLKSVHAAITWAQRGWGHINRGEYPPGCTPINGCPLRPAEPVLGAELTALVDHSDPNPGVIVGNIPDQCSCGGHLEHGHGLAGGGYGPYAECMKCERFYKCPLGAKEE